MSKKQKMSGKSFIPAKMTGKIFNSLTDLGVALGFTTPERPTPKAKNCRKCGTAMRNIPGTNVWVCDGMVEQEKDGNKKMVPCGNRAMTSVRPATQNSENSGKPKQQKSRGNHQSKPAQATTA
ncbi:MAG: hypothetical protein IJ367_04150 [Clostridia bacterium]|nr:hypothetical protein [Clostridia bacterium]